MMMMMITWNKWNDITQIQKLASPPTNYSPAADGQHSSHSLVNIFRHFFLVKIYVARNRENYLITLITSSQLFCCLLRYRLAKN